LYELVPDISLLDLTVPRIQSEKDLEIGKGKEINKTNTYKHRHRTKRNKNKPNT